jgi:hypothetical protein
MTLNLPIKIDWMETDAIDKDIFNRFSDDPTAAMAQYTLTIKMYRTYIEPLIKAKARDGGGDLIEFPTFIKFYRGLHPTVELDKEFFKYIDHLTGDFDRVKYIRDFIITGVKAYDLSKKVDVVSNYHMLADYIFNIGVRKHELEEILDYYARHGFF